MLLLVFIRLRSNSTSHSSLQHPLSFLHVIAKSSSISLQQVQPHMLAMPHVQAFRRSAVLCCAAVRFCAILFVYLQATASEYAQHAETFQKASAEFNAKHKGKKKFVLIGPAFALLQAALFISQFSAVSTLASAKVCETLLEFGLKLQMRKGTKACCIHATADGLATNASWLTRPAHALAFMQLLFQCFFSVAAWLLAGPLQSACAGPLIAVLITKQLSVTATAAHEHCVNHPAASIHDLRGCSLVH